MSILVKRQILDLIKDGSLSFDPPLDRFQLQTHSVDLRLGFTYLVPKAWTSGDEGRKAVHLDYLGSHYHFDVLELEHGQFFELLPREYVIASTLEKIRLPKDIMGVLYPRSSINRRGLSVDLSGIIDAGYDGVLAIPIRNNTATQVIRIYPGERFCQVVFQELSEPVRGRKSRYHGKDIVVGILPEANASEVRLIKKGRIGELKRKYELQVTS